MGLKIGNKIRGSGDKIKFKCELVGVLQTYSQEDGTFLLEKITGIAIVHGKQYRLTLEPADYEDEVSLALMKPKK